MEGTNVALLRGLLVGMVASLLVLGRAEAQGVADVPNPRRGHNGWVSDPSQALGASAAAIEKQLEALHQATAAEVAVAVVPSIGDAVPRDFATELFKHWGIGRKGHDDGVLVLHVLDQRRVEIETGYGSEGVLPDVKCAWLIREVALPAFRDGELGRGHEALARGIDHALRNPEATREQLLAAARSGAPAAASARTVVGQAEPARAPLAGLLGRFAPELGAGSLLAAGALVVRRRAHRAYYRDIKRRPSGPWVGWFLGMLCALALLGAAYLAELPGLAWASTGMLGLVTGLLGLGALRTFRAAERRYAPRSCGACGSTMTLLNDAKDDAFLEPGQQVEERLRSADYFVWRCGCGGQLVERFDDEGSASKCPSCGYQTEQCKKYKVLKPATESSSGLAENHHHCAHCKAQRVEQVVLARIQRDTSSRSRSSSSGGGSFGGGRSGGGGAGGSY
jgi:uncharacterized protein